MVYCKCYSAITTDSAIVAVMHSSCGHKSVISVELSFFGRAGSPWIRLDKKIGNLDLSIGAVFYRQIGTVTGNSFTSHIFRSTVNINLSTGRLNTSHSDGAGAVNIGSSDILIKRIPTANALKRPVKIKIRPVPDREITVVAEHLESDILTDCNNRRDPSFCKREI